MIKPAAKRTQIVMAVADAGDRRVGRVPGSLVVMADDPARLAQVRIRLDAQPTASADLDLNAALRRYSASHDPNRWLRLGLGLGLASLKLVGLGLAVWLAGGLAWLYRANRVVCLLLLLLYYACFWPLAQLKFYQIELARAPISLTAYAQSDSEVKRYLAASSARLGRSDLARLVGDQSPRVRLTALINLGERRDLSLLPLVLQALNDPQLNVRTKACWALGRLHDPSAYGPLDACIRHDSSWYVRDYAYAALNQIKPISRAVRMM